jgi:hypothetical protein
MSTNPFEPPKEVGTNDGQQVRAGWSFARVAVVLVLLPVSIAMWLGGVLSIAWIMMASDFPPLEVRQAIGADVAMAGIGIVASIPVLILLAVALRVSRRLSPRPPT